MAGRPKEKYKPGELTRVKKNLGPLSLEEAKRMSEILGGEIGIEQSDHHINERYQELQNQNRKTSEEKWIFQPKDSNSKVVEKKFNSTIKYSYLEKIKLFLLASHPEHNIKTTKQTIRAIFDLLLTQKNYINSNLFENSNYYFYKSIKSFVESTRFISKNIHNKYLRREEHPFYWLIIDNICNWDIESIQEEILNLKSQLNHVTLDLCSPLIKLIYRPLIILSRLNYKKDIEEAITYIYKLSTAGLFKKDLRIDRLRKSYTIATGEINNVFRTIKYRLYPLLLMFVSSKALDYNTMFRQKGHEILNFLDLTTEDLITHLNKHNIEPGVIQKTENIIKNDIIAKKEEILEIGLQQGIFFLDNMFPGAGWTKMAENPDMFPYFKSVLNLPNDAALISPEDSLQRILILIAMLKDLFYGFSNMEYGFSRYDNGKTIDLKEELDLLIKNWYLFIDELIFKNYLSTLNDYCRFLERSTDLTETEYTNRIASDLLWIKKTYICPNMHIHLPKIAQPRTKIVVPKLYKSVEQLYTILGKMVNEIFSHGQIAIETLKNPETESRFEIDNNVSLRLKFLLKEDKKKLTNGELILCSFKIVAVLDNLIKSSVQREEESDISRLYRSEESRGYKPIYSMNSDTTFSRIKNRGLKKRTDPAIQTEVYDDLTGFLGKKQFPGYLDHFISNYRDTNDVFSIIYINIQGYNTKLGTDSIKLIMSAERAINEAIHLLKDIPFRTEKDNIYIILPESDTKLALKTAERILSKMHKLYLGVCEYEPGMDENQIITHLENTISKQLPIPGITYYDNASGKYIQQSS